MIFIGNRNKNNPAYVYRACALKVGGKLDLLLSPLNRPFIKNIARGPGKLTLLDSYFRQLSIHVKFVHI